jgi:hypothetical protein
LNQTLLFSAHKVQADISFKKDLYSRLAGFNVGIDPESLVYLLSTETELELPDKRSWSDIRMFDETVKNCSSCTNISDENSNY